MAVALFSLPPPAGSGRFILLVVDAAGSFLLRFTLVADSGFVPVEVYAGC